MNFDDFEKLLALNIANFIDETHLRDACLYSITAGGKRIRPQFLCAFSNYFGGDIQNAYQIASAIEAIHCYSLIHDDLPAMDNDDLRRGMPTLHKLHNEAVAVLAGDSLLTLAFSILTQDKLSLTYKIKIEMVRLLAFYAGGSGMIKGQYHDMCLSPNFNPNNFDDVVAMQYHKTGALLTASCLLGFINSGIDNMLIYNKIKEYSYYIGIAFQLKDDILDVTSDVSILGKNTSKDKDAGKATFIELIGFTKAQNLLNNYSQNAHDIISDIENIFGKPADDIRHLTYLTVNRDK